MTTGWQVEVTMKPAYENVKKSYQYFGFVKLSAVATVGTIRMFPSFVQFFFIWRGGADT
jgi:hypothetical protein